MLFSAYSFSKMICPTSYSTAQNVASFKRHYTYADDNSKIVLSHDIEHSIIKIFEKEIQSVKKVEVLKQELMGYQDYSMLEIFRTIDKFAHGFVNTDNLRVFFKDFDFCSDLDEEDLLNWIRRYDRDVDLQLDYADFVKSLGPYCQYTQRAENLSNFLSRQKEASKFGDGEDEEEKIGIDNSYGKIDAQSAFVKAHSQKNGPQSSGRALSRITKTTAASANMTKLDRFGAHST